MYALTLFISFSIIGFFFENIINIFNPLNSGILRGPWAILYGFVIFIVLGLNKFLKRFKMSKFKEVIIYFIVITILMTILEYLSGITIELIFHKTFWDYSNIPLHMGKYIALPISLCWGFLATILNYVIYPRLKDLLKSIPNYLTLSLCVLMVIDAILTLLRKK